MKRKLSGDFLRIFLRLVATGLVEGRRDKYERTAHSAVATTKLLACSRSISAGGEAATTTLDRFPRGGEPASSGQICS